MRRNSPTSLWMTALALALASLVALGFTGSATAQETGAQIRVVQGEPVRIGSRWIASTFLNIESGKLQNTVIQLGWVSSLWSLETVSGNTVRIRSVWQQDQYLNVESGELAATAVSPDSPSAQWTMEPIGKGFYVRFRNVATSNLYINVAEGKLQASPIQQDSLSADWWLLK